MNVEPSTSMHDILRDKGVTLLNPETISFGNDIDPERISGRGVVIHPGCRISGESTLICAGARIGEEGPVTIERCQIGPHVRLKGGFFKESVFLGGAEAGSGAHFREGTILEEQASAAHTVGLKQTILFPYVTLGSLVNFCDILMAGGTSRKNHSEVGSSYIHFNYTPNQDKTTPSLLGDVPGGVMLDRPPIFLGGQGGLVGPCRLAFGTVIAAGCIQRKDELRPDRLIAGGGPPSVNVPFRPGLYPNLRSILGHNLIYIANLIALGLWYSRVRSLFVSEDFPQALHSGLMEKIGMAVEERLIRLRSLSRKMPESIEALNQSDGGARNVLLAGQKEEFHRRWPEMEEALRKSAAHGKDEPNRDRFLEMLASGIEKNGRNYLEVIHRLTETGKSAGTLWLQGAVDRICEEAYRFLPSFRRDFSS